MGFFEFRKEYINLYLDYHQLPIIEDVEDKYIDYPTSELVRERKYEGGRVGYDEAGLVSEKYPVSDALQNPADRVNPNTGLPYSEQMNKLGLNK